MSQQALRVLVVEASGRGFLNHYSHALALGLHQQGVEVELLTGERDELLDWDVPYPKQSCIQSGRKGWRCVREKIARSQPDDVHFQWVDRFSIYLYFFEFIRTTICWLPIKVR